MKQSNTNMLFKSLALCFLILGNLTFEVLCNPTVPVTVVKGEVAVPKDYVCNIINKYYSRVKKGDYFETLVGTSTAYNFKFNSPKDGKDIFSERIKAVSGKRANDVFNDFQAEIEESINQITTPKPISGENFCTFMNGFIFNNNKFESTQSNGYCISLDDIADNLDVYLTCSLDDLKTRVARYWGGEGIDDDTLSQIIKTTGTDAQTALDKKAYLIDIINKESNTKVKEIVLDRLATTATTTSTSLKSLLDVLKSYHIKNEYIYTSASAASTRPAHYKVICSIVETKVSNPPNISSTPVKIKAADITNDKKFIPQFIDTSNVLAKDVFIAISEKCSAGTANESLGKILQKLKSDFKKTVEDAWRNCVPEKTVSKDDFNKLFESFEILVPVAVKENDIADRKINLCWLSSVTDPSQQFKNYITWLESGTPAKLVSTTVSDKETAVNEFFKIVEDTNNLAAYKEKLEEELKSLRSKSSTSRNNGKVPKESTSGMKLITIIFIIVGCVLAVLIVGIAVIFGWKFYSKERKGLKTKMNL